MSETFVRTELLIGEEGLVRLRDAKVAVFGVGGVGGYAVEALARSGVGQFLLVDNDVVSESNLNRQIIALRSTIGKYKTQVMKERIADICPETVVETRECFFLPENADTFAFEEYDYVVDAIDTVSGKIALVECCQRAGTKVISAMGAGNKLDPTKFVVTDIYQTQVCPLARVMRRELKKRGIPGLKVVYSTEEAMTPRQQIISQDSRKVTPGSMAFVPGTAGLILAAEVVKDLTKQE
ncbi:MAG: tRNA threonylcarbamoyladenosine dehydratase [Lachnospiraceae bacterium]|nr:tRNA threonylcarbamoyladenosine dehydratase [Lachnospiraceae bacterium]